MDTKITSEIWQDSKFIELSDTEKLCFFWMLTNADLTGFVEVSKRKLNRDVESSYRDFERACEALSEGIVRTPQGVWIRAYIKRQLGKGKSLVNNKITVSLIKRLEVLPDEIKELINSEYPEIEEAKKVINERRKKKPIPSPYQGVREGEGEGEGEGEKRKSKVRAQSIEEVIEFCESIDLPKSDGMYFWNHWEGNGWMNAGKKIKCWKSTIRAWRDAGHLPSQKGSKPGKGSSYGEGGAF